jgi:hypothetical protein
MDVDFVALEVPSVTASWHAGGNAITVTSLGRMVAAAFSGFSGWRWWRWWWRWWRRWLAQAIASALGIRPRDLSQRIHVLTVIRTARAHQAMDAQVQAFAQAQWALLAFRKQARGRSAVHHHAALSP